jgi:hypothetical protein
MYFYRVRNLYKIKKSPWPTSLQEKIIFLPLKKYEKKHQHRYLRDLIFLDQRTNK